MASGGVVGHQDGVLRSLGMCQEEAVGSGGH